MGNSLFAAYALTLEITAATGASALQKKAPPNGEGSRHLKSSTLFTFAVTHLLGHFYVVIMVLD